MIAIALHGTATVKVDLDDVVVDKFHESLGIGYGIHGTDLLRVVRDALRKEFAEWIYEHQSTQLHRNGYMSVSLHSFTRNKYMSISLQSVMQSIRTFQEHHRILKGPHIKCGAI